MKKLILNNGKLTTKITKKPLLKPFQREFDIYTNEMKKLGVKSYDYSNFLSYREQMAAQGKTTNPKKMALFHARGLQSTKEFNRDYKAFQRATGQEISKNEFRRTRLAKNVKDLVEETADQLYKEGKTSTEVARYIAVHIFGSPE